MLDYTSETIFSHENLLNGYYEYYITTVYDEGESISSDTVSAFLTNIDKNDRFSIQIYPNPAKDFVQVNSEAKIDNLKIYDLKGQIKVVFIEINKKKLNLSVSGYNPGVYLFRLESDNKVVNKRIVIQ